MVKTNPSLPPGRMKLVVAGTLQIGEDGAIGEEGCVVAGTLQIGEDRAIGGNLFETVQSLTKGCLQCSLVIFTTRNLTYKSCCAVHGYACCTK